VADQPTLYSPALLTHARAPQHAGRLPAPTHTATVDNPLCGDRVTLHLRLDQGQIAAVAHKTRGCALCIASASVMAAQLAGMTAADGHAAVRSALDTLAPEGDLAAHSHLALFVGLRAAPARARCVALPWQALAAALEET